MYATPYPGYGPFVPVQLVEKKPVMAWENDTHSLAVGYALWLVGFTGAHRFYYGRPLSGLLWFFTFGLLGVGWLVDAFLLPGMDRAADYRYVAGDVNYPLAWLLLVFGGWLGLHRFYQGKWITGILYLLTGGLFLVGVIYDVFTLNEQIDDENRVYRNHQMQYFRG